MELMKSIIVAYDADRTIGRDGELPWAGQLPADMKHFREITSGQSVIMGRKTFDSLPESYRPLPNRHNIVLSMSATAINGVDIARTVDEAYSLAGENAFVIGGAEVYRQTLLSVDKVFATEIMARTVNGDAFFPNLNMTEWEIEESENYAADTKNAFDYSFVTYARRTPTE